MERSPGSVRYDTHDDSSRTDAAAPHVDSFHRWVHRRWPDKPNVDEPDRDGHDSHLQR